MQMIAFVSLLFITTIPTDHKITTFEYSYLYKITHTHTHTYGLSNEHLA